MTINQKDLDICRKIESLAKQLGRDVYIVTDSLNYFSNNNKSETVGHAKMLHMNWEMDKLIKEKQNK